MFFDVAVIGGGLAGFACAISLLERGCKVALISAGQSAMHFSSGSFDLLSFGAGKEFVENIPEALEELIAREPGHPYALLGAKETLRLAGEAQGLITRCDIKMQGSFKRNHLRLSPLGVLLPAWLSADEVPQMPSGSCTHWSRCTIVNIEGFLDFYPELLQDSMQHYAAEVRCAYIDIPPLDFLRRNPAEFRSTNISRVLDKVENFGLFAEALSGFASSRTADELIILPACVGFNRPTAAQELTEKLGCMVALMPTLPPSMLGARMNLSLARRFQELGGVYMPGDTVTGGSIANSKVAELHTRNHAEIPLRVGNVVLASGSFFSRGLVSDYDGAQGQIRERIFGLDIVGSAELTEWSRQDVFAPQPYMGFGVKVDKQLRCALNGTVLENLYAAGMVLGGFDPVQQGCGAGVALVSALAVSEQIGAGA